MYAAFFASALTLITAQAPTTTPPARELWAGHALLVGELRLPLLGKVETRTDSFVLAEVTREGGKISLLQRTCSVQLAPPPGVTVTITDARAQRLPTMKLDFERRDDGLWYQAPLHTGWTNEDADGDGKPGLTIEVDAPICGGKLFVGLQTTSMSRGGPRPDRGLEGELRSRVVQTVLDTDGACLGVLVKGSDDRARGTFAYAPVDPSATCASLLKSPWPVKADEPTKKR